MSSPLPPRYKTDDWPAYNGALRQRGSLTIWLDPKMVWVPQSTGKRGRQRQFSDAAIQTCLTLKVLFGMALRQIEPGNGIDSSDNGEEGLSRAFCVWSAWTGRSPIQHFEQASKDLGCQHPLSWLRGIPAPSDRQHRNQGRR